MIVRSLFIGLFGAAVALVATVMARRHGLGVDACPSCNARVPFLRRSWSLRQILWGGHTCLICRHEFDSYGGDAAPRPKSAGKGASRP